MDFSIDEILFYLLFIDAVGASLFAWLGDDKWYKRNFRIFSRYFPITKGWATYYLILVLWVGSLLYRSGELYFAG